MTESAEHRAICAHYCRKCGVPVYPALWQLNRDRTVEKWADKRKIMVCEPYTEKTIYKEWNWHEGVEALVYLAMEA